MLMLAALLAFAPSTRAALLKRAERGEVRAEVALALSLQDEGQGPVDLAASEQWLRKAAATGDREGEFFLGRFYHLVPKAHHDRFEAQKWYLKAADQGDAWALNNLGLLAEGSSDPVERGKTMAYFRKGAEGGDWHAQENLADRLRGGDFGSKNPTEARYWYSRAGAQGDAESEAVLGVMWWKGEGGPVDFALARQHLTRAEALGNGWAALNLGILQEEGHGAPPDPVAARVTYLKAAGLGNADAMERLGWLFRQGKGVTRDIPMARQWFERATKAGDLHGWSAMGTLYSESDAGLKNDAEAIKYFYMGAYLGEPQCENNVGAFYHHGRGGVGRDLGNAFAWFTMALEDGDPTAKGNLATLDKEIGPIDRLRGKALIPGLRSEIARRREAANLD